MPYGFMKFFCLFCLALICDSGGFLGGFFGVAKIVILDRLQIGVKLVTKRQSGREINLGLSLFRNIIEVFHQRADGISMRDQQYTLS